MSVPPGPPPGRPPIIGMRPPGPPPGGPPGFRPPIHLGGGYPAPPFANGFPPGPPMMPNFPPPLPAGWSEHTAPDGVTKYFYNSNTKESTYTRPSFAPLPNIGGSNPPAAVVTVKEKKKKEKPKNKVPIPGTSWTRVTTTEGNVFYFEKESKRSEWSIPEEIKNEVEELEKDEREQKEAEEADRKRQAEEERLEKLRERERVRAEVEEERKRRQEEKERKRKERGDVDEDGDEDVERQPKVSRKNGAEADEGEEQFAPDDPEDEEAWMKAVAAEFAEQDALAQAEKEKDQAANEKAEEEAAMKVFAVPEKVSVSLEEGRALFKALLIEKNISPFAPWDQSLPLFINDPRYILLGSMKDRREVYEEYCRDVGRARRLGKATESDTKSKKSDPERDYKALLREEVTSTRTRWDDFRKKWKKERKFYSFGRDDKEREKVFKTHLKELGERKRADAQRAEQDFFDLLKEVDDLSSSSVWSQVKKSISSDPRYDAVGSSSLREELFNTHVRKLASTSTKHETAEEIAERKLKERKAKEEASLRERQAKVREEQEKATKEANKSRAGAGREEAERLFGSLLVDQVRDHEIFWNDAVRFLEQDPRFNHPSLNPHDKVRFFNAHIARIAGKRSDALNQLFQTHSPKLTTTYDEVYPNIVDDPVVKRLGLEGEALEQRYKAWKKGKEAEARQEFDTMLGENSFVEFWGKMRKKVLDEAALKVKEDEMDEGEGLGDGGAADITALAKQIDLEEIKSVLRRDGRYRQFDHIPELREQWLQEYLERQQGLTGSETIHAVGQTR